MKRTERILIQGVRSIVCGVRCCVVAGIPAFTTMRAMARVDPEPRFDFVVVRGERVFDRMTFASGVDRVGRQFPPESESREFLDGSRH